MKETLCNAAPIALMTLDEAIQHCIEKSEGCNQCAKEHQQLKCWLEELRRFRNYANQIKQLGIQNKNLCIKGSEIEWLKHNTEISNDEYLERICEINNNLLENELTISKLTSEMISLDEIIN